MVRQLNQWYRKILNLVLPYLSRRKMRPIVVRSVQPEEEIGPSLFFSQKDVLQTAKIRFFNFFRSLRKKRSHSSRRSARRRQITSYATGRNIRLVKHLPGITRLDPYHTIMHSLLTGSSQLPGQSFQVKEEDFAGWFRKEIESMTLVLAVDLSRSTSAFRDILAEILKSLREYFTRHNDRIGLVALQGVQGRVLNHPTRNHRVIIKNLLSMKIQGSTPLADGLRKSLQMTRIERFKNPGSKSIVVLMSDCFPEPLTNKYDDLLDEPVYKDSIKTARLFRMRRVYLLIINPSYRSDRPGKRTPGERLTDRMIDESRGNLISLSTESSVHSGSDFLRHQHSDIEKILKMIDNAFQSQQLGSRDISFSNR